jgi:hypothetical protein
MAPWHGADDAMALLAMKCREDNANTQGYLDGHAAMAPQKAATRANVLAGSCRREDDAYAKAFASATDKRNRREAQYVAQLGFTSSSEFFAWVAECDASPDGAVAEAPNRTPALAKKLLAEEQRHHKTATQERALADKANKRRQVAAQEKALDDEAYEQRRAATQEKALADKAYEQRLAATREEALSYEVNKQCRQVTAALEKALADKAYEQRLAATREKALADKVNKRCRHVMAARENALANNAYVDGQLQTACRHSQPR